MLTFCKACCPRLAIEVPLNDPLSQFRLAYWLDQGFVPDAACGRLCAVRYRVLQHSKCTGGQDVRLVVTLFPAGSG